jgi:hypothetical protein
MLEMFKSKPGERGRAHAAAATESGPAASPGADGGDAGAGEASGGPA